MTRYAEIERNTRETQIKVAIDLDGKGKSSISTGVAFMDHMLTLFSRHGLFDLTVEAKGDLEVDAHHLFEDLGIVLGDALTKALGDKAGIKRYGSFLLPMDETLVMIALDLSGRPGLYYSVNPPAQTVGRVQALEKATKGKSKAFQPCFNLFSIVMHDAVSILVILPQRLR